MRFSRYGLGASYLATHNHPAIPEVTDCMVASYENPLTVSWLRLSGDKF
jgi:hypothetical protein